MIPNCTLCNGLAVRNRESDYKGDESYVCIDCQHIFYQSEVEKRERYFAIGGKVLQIIENYLPYVVLIVTLILFFLMSKGC